MSLKLASGEAVMAVDRSLRVLGWNSVAAELTGIPEADAVGRYCWEVLCADDDRGNLACHADCPSGRLACEGYPVPTRALWIKAHGEKRRVSLTTVAVDAGGDPLILHVLRDGAGAAPDAASEDPPALTSRQQEILELLAEGVPSKVIARQLGLSQSTVRNHISRLLRRFDAHSQLEAVAKARRAALLDR